DEHRFDPGRRVWLPGYSGAPSMGAGWTGAAMTAVWLAPEPADRPGAGGAPPLRLVPGRGLGEPIPSAPKRPGGTRPVPLEVRRRRTLLAAMGLLLVGLALPLSGTGGRSHATGPAPAGIPGPVTYTVKAGDSLWSIAERADPNADPRPLVARLASQDGSDRVVPGERIAVP
ncbi:MAG: LysM peptidoglycan-binding domain-containing protein, partial [Acidimicrobiales bacterium]